MMQKIKTLNLNRLKSKNSVSHNVFLITWRARSTVPFLLCYRSLVVYGVGAVVFGAMCVFSAPYVLFHLGFTATGVAAHSVAAWLMSLYGGAVPAGGIVATLQSFGAVGLTWSAISNVFYYGAWLGATIALSFYNFIFGGE